MFAIIQLGKWHSSGSGSGDLTTLENAVLGSISMVEREPGELFSVERFMTGKGERKSYVFRYQKKKINNYELNLEKPPIRFYIIIIISIVLGIVLRYYFW